jgi:hypothetical protein
MFTTATARGRQDLATLAQYLLLALVCCSSAQAQHIPRFATRPQPLKLQQPPKTSPPAPRGSSSALAAGAPTVPITPSVFTFSIGDVVNSSVCKDQVGGGAAGCPAAREPPVYLILQAY